MAESEELFYFCCTCVSIHREPVFTFFNSETSIFTCTECGLRFQIGYHTTKRTPAHRCIDCKEMFGTSLLLKLHSEEHFGEGPYKCSACQKVFFTYSAWEWHRKQSDTILELDCRKCWKSFKGKVCPGVHFDLAIKFRVYCAECCMGSNSIEYV
ncbi:hypothetical protein TNIN_411941 [Trichonephila inaurata madagascariensis]|uniref:C2H2-type domain-containing protein n=1 Tax=Trichonephila inaurata madagascariensis TaxID=2747483 RepID=A0A8X6Y577_9ARAC|nr:hypothetical protein TNIN_411941 [Trichonephila inaurata madagascariensis]